jgi:hypothetical protein
LAKFQITQVIEIDSSDWPLSDQQWLENKFNEYSSHSLMSQMTPIWRMEGAFQELLTHLQVDATSFIKRSSPIRTSISCVDNTPPSVARTLLERKAEPEGQIFDPLRE